MWKVRLKDLNENSEMKNNDGIIDVKKDVAYIFRNHFLKLRKKYAYPYHVLRVVESIIQCRTESLGRQIYSCDHCGHIEEIFLSCGNRHCPKCQYEKKQKWLKKQIDRILPIDYFHVVFTIPEELNNLVFYNQKTVYAILFKAIRETLSELGKDRLGAELGAIAILHTWGQNLSFHPHVHCIVTGGGLSITSDRWVSCKKGYLLPVQVMSSLFRGKFLSYVKDVQGELKGKGQIKIDREQLSDILKPLYKKDWVVYSKPPFGSSEDVFKYIGNYTHRVAISNSRIEQVSETDVTFKWRDYRDKNSIKLMTLSVEEFMRRFLLHVLPPKFVKIRYFGILANAAAGSREKCMKLFAGWTDKKQTSEQIDNDAKKDEQKKQCTNCNSGQMHFCSVVYRSRDRPYSGIAK